MVCNNNFYTEFSGSRHRAIGCNSVVNRENESHTFGVKFFYNAIVNPVTFPHPARNSIIDIRSQSPESSQQQSRARHPVSIIITTNRNFLPSRNRFPQQFDTRSQIGELIHWCGQNQRFRFDKPLHFFNRIDAAIN